MSGIGALQVEVRAGARMASLRFLEAALPPSAYVARPAGLGEELEHVGAAEQADHLAALDHRHAADALADEKARGLVDAGVLGDGDHARTHDVARYLALLRKTFVLGKSADP